MCLASLPAARPVGPSWDLSRGQIFHTLPLIHACKNAPFPQPDTIPRPMNPGTAPNPPSLYKVGGDVWPWFVCLSLFFPQQCSTDPVCLNPLDVTLMDCRGGGWICVLVWRRSFRWEMFDAWSSRATRGKEKGGSVISSCRCVAGSKLIWCCYVTVIIILYNHISSFVKAPKIEGHEWT